MSTRDLYEIICEQNEVKEILHRLEEELDETDAKVHKKDALYQGKGEYYEKAVDAHLKKFEEYKTEVNRYIELTEEIRRLTVPQDDKE